MRFPPCSLIADVRVTAERMLKILDATADQP